MNDKDQPEPMEPAELQFDHAEYQTPPASAVTCSVCNQTVPEQYYEINGKVICPPCRKAIEARFTGGSGLGRFVRASLFGFIAAVVGCGIYYAVSKITGYNLALISILVGWMVGSAVRRGANFRGGWVYQILAMFLTYTAVVAIDIPDIVVALAEVQKKQDQEDAAAQPAPAGPNQAAAEANQGEAEAKPPAAEAKTDEAEPKQAAAEPKPGEAAPKPIAVAAAAPRRRVLDRPPAQRALAFAVAAIFLLVLAYALPFLAGFKNLIGLLIIFFALQQAWYLNRKPKITITGPYMVGAPGAQAPEVGEVPIEGAQFDD
jgi:hypothetical protein